MKKVKNILTGSLAVLLASTLITTLDKKEADAKSEKEISASEYYNKELASELKGLIAELNVKELATGNMEPYFKRQVKLYGYKAKLALKSNDFTKMSVATNELKKIYKEMDEARGYNR
ncbi:TPA: complement inhibitor SCIN family protein [Staphylococcus aureus]